MNSEELEPRVSALEGEVREIRARLTRSETDAAAARVLAGAADRDLVDLRDEMRSRIDLTAAGQQQIVGMLQTLIDREAD